MKNDSKNNSEKKQKKMQIMIDIFFCLSVLKAMPCYTTKKYNEIIFIARTYGNYSTGSFRMLVSCCFCYYFQENISNSHRIFKCIVFRKKHVIKITYVCHTDYWFYPAAKNSNI